MKLSIIIPVYNEERTVSTLLKKVAKVDFADIKREIIVVDDGSKDGSSSAILGSRFDIENLKIIKHTKNLGKGSAIKSGIKEATGDYIVIQDADLEYNPQEIVKLIKTLKKGEIDVVYGTRLNRLPNLFRDEKIPLFLMHYFGNRFLSFITSILYFQWLTDMETCYKIFPKSAVTNMRINARGFEFEPEITAKLLKKGYKIKEIPITTIPRNYKQGKKLHAGKEGIKALWALIKYRFID